VTGVTGVARISNDPEVGHIAERAVLAVAEKPHGIYGVDMKCDKRGTPNPTEINIGRFFTTIQFFTELGLNIPDLYVKLGTGIGVEPVIDVLPEGWYWVRSMDSAPRLVCESELAA